MILFPHLLAGALVGAEIKNLAAIFLVAVFSHFLLDVIPHWDYSKKEISGLYEKKFLFFMAKVATDLIFGIFLLWLIFRNSSLPYQNIAWGAFFGILPDGLIFLNQITKRKNGVFLTSLGRYARWRIVLASQNKYLEKFQNFHDRLHWLFRKNEKTPLGQGFLIEIIVVLGLVFTLTIIN